MDDIRLLQLDEVKRDLALRGYNSTEVGELLKYPVLLIPGPITSGEIDTPIQKLTNHIAFISKDLSRQGIQNRVVLQKDIPRQYMEERHAHVDLGTIVVSLATLQQLEGFANIAQILDFLLSLIQMKFSVGRTRELTPNVKFDLQIHNGDKAIKWRIEGPANTLPKMVTPRHIDAVVVAFKETSKDEQTQPSDSE